MKIIDKVLEDKELVKKTIIENFCPEYFSMKYLSPCSNGNGCENVGIEK